MSTRQYLKRYLREFPKKEKNSSSKEAKDQDRDSEILQQTIFLF